MGLIKTPGTPSALSELNREDPITAGISYAIDPWYINPKDFSLVGTKPRATPKGGMQRGFYSTYGTGTNTDRIALTPKLNTFPTQQFSWMFLINRTGSGGTTGRLISQVGEANVATATNAATQFGMDFSGTDSVFVYPATPVDRDCVVIITMDGTGANDPSVYYDGILQTITSRSPAPTGTLVTTNTNAWSLGNRASDLARSFEGSLGPFVWWDRVLSASEAIALSQNPRRVFRPRSRAIPVPVSAGDINLAAAPSAQSAASGAAGITQTHLLTAAPSAQSAAAAAGAITQAHELAGAAATQLATSSTAAITQTHQLAAAASSQSAACSTGSIAGGIDLSAAPSAQSAAGGVGAISQTHVLICAPSVQDAIADASAIVQAHLLMGAACTQAAVSGYYVSVLDPAYLWTVSSNRDVGPLAVDRFTGPIRGVIS